MNTHPQCRIWINGIPIIPTPDWWDSLGEEDKIHSLSICCRGNKNFPGIITHDVEYAGVRLLQVLFDKLPIDIQHYIINFHRGDFS